MPTSAFFLIAEPFHRADVGIGPYVFMFGRS